MESEWGRNKECSDRKYHLVDQEPVKRYGKKGYGIDKWKCNSKLDFG